MHTVVIKRLKFKAYCILTSQPLTNMKLELDKKYFLLSKNKIDFYKINKFLLLYFIFDFQFLIISAYQAIFSLFYVKKLRKYASNTIVLFRKTTK